MRIALFTPDMRAGAGGPPQVVAGSARALALRGHEVTIFALAGDASEIAPGVTLRIFAPDAPRPLQRSKAMRAALTTAAAACDVLHVHAIWEQGAADAAAIFARAGKPVFVSAHGMLDRWSLRQSRAKKWVVLHLLATGRMLRDATALVFGTAEERDEATIAPATPRAVVPNGIDLAQAVRLAQGDTSIFTDRFPQIATWRRTIVYLSRIHRKKGLDDLVAARIALGERHSETGILIVGIPQDAGLLAEIEADFARAGLQHAFAITTDISGAAAKAALGLADIFALPSHQEGFSMAILEAMGCGLPLLITDKCHLPEIADWNAGVVVPDTVAGIGQGLEALLALPDAELVATGARARAAAERLYDWDSVAAQLETLYAGTPA